MEKLHYFFMIITIASFCSTLLELFFSICGESVIGVLQREAAHFLIFMWQESIEFFKRELKRCGSHMHNKVL